MAVEIHVLNFQSLKDVRLKVEGFTAITGPNNSGKSALMRAIRGAFQNTPGTSFVRLGESEMSVSLKFDDGRSLVWKKGTAKRSKPTYIIDGGKPIHPGRFVPDEVRDFGVTPIKVMGNEVWPTLAPQFTGQVFLLDQPGSSLAEAVADVERVSKLNGALRAAERDRRDVQGKLKVRKEDEGRLAAELETFKGFDDVVAQTEAIEKDREQAIRVLKALQGVVGFRDKLREAQAKVSSLEGVEAVVVPDSAPASSLRFELEPLLGLRDELVEAQAKVARLGGIEQVEVPEVAEAQDLRDELDTLLNLRARYEKATQEVSVLCGVEDVDLVLDADGVGRLRDAVDTIKGIRSRLVAARSQVSTVEDELGRATTEAERVEEEVAELLGQFEMCPTCGKPMEGHA